MNESTELQVAAAAHLSERMQRHMWARGDVKLRRVLAGREDFPDDLAAEAVEDPALIGAWVSRTRTNTYLLTRAVHLAVNEHTLMDLQRQPHLPSEAVAVLAEKATPMVGWYLLRNQNLSTEQARKLVTRYVNILQPMTDGPGRIFEEVIGEDPALWEAVAAASDSNTIPLLRAAAQRAHDDIALQDAVVTTLERIDAAGQLDTRSERSFHSCVQELLRSWHLPTQLIERLLRLEHVGTHAVELRERLDSDIATTIAALDCQHRDPSTLPSMSYDDVAAGHVQTLTLLRMIDGPLRLPLETIALETLIHRNELEADVVRELLHACKGPASRAAFAFLEREGRFDDMLTLARELGTIVLDDAANKAEVLVALAREGSDEVTDRNVPDALASDVVNAYRPLRKLLQHPGLCAVVIESIETLPAREADVALTLLGDWEEDLPSLIAAARSLTI